MLTAKTLLADYPTADAKALLVKALTPSVVEPRSAPKVSEWSLDEPKRRAPVLRKGFARTYQVTRTFNRSKWNTWTHHMVETILAHTNTRDADNAHAASGQYADKRLDWTWAEKSGYITFNI